MRLDVRDTGAGFRRYLTDRRYLLENCIRDCIGSQLQLEAAEIGAIRIAGMCSYRQIAAHGLLDGSSHSEFITCVTAAGDVHGRYKRHEGFLGTVCDGVGHFAHIAIQVDGLHSWISSCELSSFSCSISRSRASVISISLKRISSRGRNWPTECISAEIMLAILG